MPASHDSIVNPAPQSEDPAFAESPMAAWAAGLGGWLLASVGVIALIANVGFLRALGFGLSALIAGAGMLVLLPAVRRRDWRAALGCAGLWLAHGLWVLIRVRTAGGDPSVGLWTFRLLLAATMIGPALHAAWRRPG